MESSPTDLYLPQSLPYPIKLTSLDATPNSTIKRGTRLLSYSFIHFSNGIQETRFGTWDSAIEGDLHSWLVKVGDVITQNKASDRPAVIVIEPCKHGMQLGGLCVLCGKDMTSVDYTGFSDASRASIQMTHSAFGPTVSFEEAQRIERETADHLLKSRKLSLIVDLDQTIVHATVDPTVGEWIAEGEAWETRQAKKAAHDPDDSDDSSSDDNDEECNPNWEALRDVKKFRLGPESFVPPSLRGAQQGKGKQKLVENEGCMYYIKPRPGWKEFLQEASTKYEMHVYTMGTRAYAEQVCAAIDPDGKLFGGRVLSRDESGSLTQKSLQRLFPCDTSMVVIIDDRADVWEWSPNLLKVVPYDFFVGIGDINSAFLPKLEPLTSASTPLPTSKPSETANGGTPSPVIHPEHTGAVDATVVASTAPEESAKTATTKVLMTRNNAALEAQLEERPLAKKQEALREHELHPDGPGVSVKKTPSPEPEKVPKKPLLKNDDVELERVGKLLRYVHRRFFEAYDARSPENSRRKTGPSSKAYDVTRIIPRLRSEVLEGVHILFSSVIPLDTKPETTEIWRMAHMFGARCSTELTSDITHVVAAKRGTVKVDMARKRGGIKIVWLAWFTDCIASWQRQDEKPYLLDDLPAVPPIPSGSSPIHTDHQISSDPDPDEDDWDEEPFEGVLKDTGSLQLSAINWSDINDEVEAAMNESDDEDDNNDDMKSVRSEDDVMGNATSSVINSPRLNRKRLRSVTPSDGGGSQNGAGGRDDLRSPLSKRKKLAADRTGYSRLKETISADELVFGGSEGGGEPSRARAASPKMVMKDEMEEDDDDDEDEEDEEEDDFLARALEEEWG